MRSAVVFSFSIFFDVFLRMRFDSENRILVLGNSGSGKTWLTRHLATLLNLEMVSLDEICWEPGGYYRRRADEVVRSDILNLSQSSNWIVEGVYGDLAEVMLPRLTSLCWLDLDPDFCAESVSRRGFENIPWLDTEAKIQGYLSHIQSYRKTSGPMSHQFHEHVYNTYPGKKITFKSREAVNAFIGDPKLSP